MNQKTEYNFDFYVEGLMLIHVEYLLKIITAIVEVFGGTMGGGFSEVTYVQEGTEPEEVQSG